MRCRRLLIELKTGSPNPDHRAEHLTYSLLDTLQTGLAPWRAATCYLDAGTWVTDDITLELLRVAAGRLVTAVRRLIELDGRPPTRQAGWRCGSCTLAEGCAERLRGSKTDTALGS